MLHSRECAYPLQELARVFSAGGDHSTAIVLRKLAQAGYATLEQVDRTPDWILLSLPGIGAKRLSAVRLLTRTEWQAPSRETIQVVTWFLSAAQYALRFWPWESLASFIECSARPMVEAMPSDKRLALDVFSQAAQKALTYCPDQELANLVSLVAHGPPDCRAGGNWHEQDEKTMVDTRQSSRRQDAGRESDHYAFSREKRREIVQQYWAAREKALIANKEHWAQSNYNISSRTLLNYEREFRGRDSR